MNYWWSFAILQLTINPELTTYSLCVIQPSGICISNEQWLNNELVDYLNKYGGVYGEASEPHPALSLYLDIHKSSIISVVLRNLWDLYTNWWFMCFFCGSTVFRKPTNTTSASLNVWKHVKTLTTVNQELVLLFSTPARSTMRGFHRRATWVYFYWAVRWPGLFRGWWPASSARMETRLNDLLIRLERAS